MKGNREESYASVYFASLFNITYNVEKLVPFPTEREGGRVIMKVNSGVYWVSKSREYIAKYTRDDFKFCQEKVEESQYFCPPIPVFSPISGRLGCIEQLILNISATNEACPLVKHESHGILDVVLGDVRCFSSFSYQSYAYVSAHGS